MRTTVGFWLPASRTLRPVSRLHRRAFLHTDYRHVELEVDPTLQQNCDCDIRDLNRCLNSDKKLDSALVLPAKVPFYHRHVMLISPVDPAGQDPSWKSGWQSKLELNPKWPYSAIGELKSHLRDTHKGDGILINAISVSRGDLTSPQVSTQKARFLTLPDMKVYEIEAHELQEFANFLGEGKVQKNKKVSFYNYLKGADAASKLLDARSDPNEGPPFKIFQGQDYHRDITLVCGHNERDERCGLIAPQIIEKLDAQVDSDLAIISHIGGHKFAGNIIFYNFLGLDSSKAAKVDGLWFGKILPSAVPTLLSHLKKKEIVTPWFRGSCSL
ncbi:LAFA_0E03642g1_1 [Lachancea sp. 'fantastica']|nr:LAFA_0E03642g1_1 [Lachancea sp. 'fantastica']